LSQRHKLAFAQRRAFGQVDPKTVELVEALCLLRHNGFDKDLKNILWPDLRLLQADQLFSTTR